MKRLLLGLCLLGFATGADAKQLIIQKVGRDPGQLHQELLAAFPMWQAALNPATGRVEDPGLCRVEVTETEIRITVPNTADEAVIRTVITAHVPKAPSPNPDTELTTAITNATTVQELKDALLGKTRQGKVRAERP